MEGRPWKRMFLDFIAVDVFVYYFLASLVCAGKVAFLLIICLPNRFN
jgi:hypothetical protein